MHLRNINKYLTLFSVCLFFLPQWSCSVLGHQKSSAQVCDHGTVGEQLCISLQQRQSQLALQHVWL